MPPDEKRKRSAPPFNQRGPRQEGSGKPSRKVTLSQPIAISIELFEIMVKAKVVKPPKVPAFKDMEKWIVTERGELSTRHDSETKQAVATIVAPGPDGLIEYEAEGVTTELAICECIKVFFNERPRQAELPEAEPPDPAGKDMPLFKGANGAFASSEGIVDSEEIPSEPVAAATPGEALAAMGEALERVSTSRPNPIAGAKRNRTRAQPIDVTNESGEEEDDTDFDAGTMDLEDQLERGLEQGDDGESEDVYDPLDDVGGDLPELGREETPDSRGISDGSEEPDTEEGENLPVELDPNMPTESGDFWLEEVDENDVKHWMLDRPTMVRHQEDPDAWFIATGYGYDPERGEIYDFENTKVVWTRPDLDPSSVQEGADGPDDVEEPKAPTPFVPIAGARYIDPTPVDEAYWLENAPRAIRVDQLPTGACKFRIADNSVYVPQDGAIYGNGGQTLWARENPVLGTDKYLPYVPRDVFDPELGRRERIAWLMHERKYFQDRVPGSQSIFVDQGTLEYVIDMTNIESGELDYYPQTDDQVEEDFARFVADGSIESPDNLTQLLDNPFRAQLVEEPVDAGEDRIALMTAIITDPAALKCNAFKPGAAERCGAPAVQLQPLDVCLCPKHRKYGQEFGSVRVEGERILWWSDGLWYLKQAANDLAVLGSSLDAIQAWTQPKGNGAALEEPTADDGPDTMATLRAEFDELAAQYHHTIDWSAGHPALGPNKGRKSNERKIAEAQFSDLLDRWLALTGNPAQPTTEGVETEEIIG